MSRAARVLVALAAAAASVLPSAATAANGIATAPPRSGPALAGDTAIWAVPAGPGGFDLRRASNGKPATIRRFRPMGSGQSLEPAIAASPSRLVVDYALGDHTTPWLQRNVLTAPLGGEFETLDGDCALFGTPDRPRSIDVSGPVVAYGRCTADGRQELVVRDFSTPAPVEHVVPGAFPIGVRIAGRYLAWLEEGTGQPYTASGITVYDWLLGTVAYRLPKASMPGDVHDLDLQDDGKVAFSFAGKKGQVAWASQSEPSAHVLDLPARANYEVRIAGDRIGYEAGRHAGAGELTLADIGVSDLAGHTHRVGTLGEGSVFTDDFDFDGTHLAWWSYGCTRAFVHIADANGAAQISPRRSGCRLRFAGKPTISGNIVRLRVDCFGFPLGSCRARDVTLTVRRAQRVLVVGRGRTAGHVVLTPLGHRLLRLRRPLRVRARATLSDDAGRSERRSGRLTLR